MKVKDLIDALCKCSPEAEVEVCLDSDPIDYATTICGVNEISNKLSDENSVYLLHC